MAHFFRATTYVHPPEKMAVPKSVVKALQFGCSVLRLGEGGSLTMPVLHLTQHSIFHKNVEFQFGVVDANSLPEKFGAGDLAGMN